jgi:hypothetical protein
MWYTVSMKERETMTNELFNKNNFNFARGYLTYNGRFVARFKYRNAPLTAGRMKQILVKNFTPSEYFKEIEEEGKTPGQVLKDRGLFSVDPNTDTARIGNDKYVLSSDYKWVKVKA